MIEKIENDKVYFKFSRCESNRLNNVKKWASGEYKQDNFFSPNEWIVVPTNKLSSLNFRLMIISIKNNS